MTLGLIKGSPRAEVSAHGTPDQQIRPLLPRDLSCSFLLGRLAEVPGLAMEWIAHLQIEGGESKEHSGSTVQGEEAMTQNHGQSLVRHTGA